MTAKKSGTIDPDFGRAPGGRKLPPRKSQQVVEPVDVPARSDVADDVEIFTPPFLGARVAKGISLDEIAGFINETALFRNQWQFRPESGESDDEFKARIRPQLRAELEGAKAEGWLVPAVAWGYFPVNAAGDDLVVWTDDDAHDRAVPLQLPAPAEGPVPLHRRLLPQRRLRRRRLRRLPRGDGRARGDGTRRRAVRREQVPGLPAAATVSRWR